MEHSHRTDIVLPTPPFAAPDDGLPPSACALGLDRRPGLLALSVLLAFTAPLHGLRAGAVGGLSDVVLLVTLGGLGIRWLVRPWRRPATFLVPIAAAAALLATAGLFATMWSVAPGKSLLNIARFTVAIGGLLLVCSSVPRSRGDITTLVWAFVLGVTLSSAWSFFNENPVIGRAAGLSHHSNILGITSVFATSLLLGVLPSAGRRARWLACGCFGLLAMGLVHSGSRAATVAFPAAVIVFLASTQQRRVLRYVVVACMLALGAIATGLYELPATSGAGRLFSNEPTTSLSDAERAEALDRTLAEITKHPLTGTGFADATAAHNIPLQVLQSAGVVGVVAFGGLAYAIAAPLVRRRRDPLVAGFLAMYASYLLVGMASNPVWDRWVWFPIACGTGLLTTEAALRRADIAAPVHVG